MITLKNLNQPNTIPALFNTEKEFIDYTINEALWQALPTGEIPTMEQWGFIKVVDDEITDEYGNKDTVVHWEANLDACLEFWEKHISDNWEIIFN